MVFTVAEYSTVVVSAVFEEKSMCIVRRKKMAKNRFLMALLVAVLLVAGTSAAVADTWTTYNKNNTSGGIDNNSMRDVEIASNGDLWLATYGGGISKYDGTNWTLYKTSQGLVNNTTWDIDIDSAGNIWIATGGGLSKYDGTNFTNFNTGNSDISTNNLRDVYVDSSGNAWIGTYGDGLDKYDGTNWTNWYTGNSDIPNNRVWDIEPDGSYLWLGTEGGVTKFDKSSTFTSYSTSNSDLLNNTCRDVELDSGGALWICTGSGLNKLDGTTWSSWQTGDGLAKNTCYDVDIDSSDIVYVVHSGNGASKLDGTDFTIYSTSNSDIIGNVAWSVEIETDSKIYFGTTAGVSLFETGATAPTAAFSGSPTSGDAPLTVNFTDSSTGTVTSWSWTFGDSGTSTSQNPSHQYTSSGDYTVALTASGSAGSDIETKTDYISVTTASAPTAAFSGSPTSGDAPLTVNFTDSSTGTVTSWSWTFGDGGTSTAENPSHEYTDSGDYTVALTVSGSAGSDSESKTDYISVSEAATEAWTTYNKANTSNGLGSNSIRNIAFNGDVTWVAAIGSGGLSKFDGTSWTNYKTGDGLVNNYVWNLDFKSNGDLVIGTNGGVSVYDGTNFTNYTTGNSDLNDNNVRTVKVDPDGSTIWVGTLGGGVNKYDGTDWTYWKTTNSDLPNNDVWGIDFDSSGNKWFATFNGVAKLDGTNWSTWDTPDLPHDDCYEVLVDDSDNIWVATIRGVSKYDGTNWTTYEEENGMPEEVCRDIAIDNGGIVWVGTNGGGVCKLNGTTWTQFKTANSDIANNYVWDVAIKSTSERWFGHNAGVSVLNTGELTSMLAHYTFDETSGTTAADSSGNDYDATVNKSTAWDTSGYDANGCLDFDGSVYVTVPDDMFVTAVNEVSIAVWLNGDSVQPYNDMICHGEKNSIDKIYISCPWSTGTVIWRAGATQTGWENHDQIYWNPPSADYYKGEWNHYVFTKDNVPGRMRIYHNGVLATEGLEKYHDVANIDSGTFYIGSRVDATQKYHGKLDDFRIYDKELTPIDVVSLYEGITCEYDGSGETYYVSASSGSDSNPGTLSEPFETIQAAADIMTPGDTCYIRSGTYRETVRPGCYGSSSAPIKFEAYQNESVTVSGADEVDLSWSVHSGNIYKATTTEEFIQLFVDSNMMNEARYPNATVNDLLHMTREFADSGTSTSRLYDSNLPSGSWNGGKVHILSGEEWRPFVKGITNYSAGNYFDYSDSDWGGETYFNPVTDNPFYIFGALAGLDIATEWYLDTSGDKLYLWCPGNDTPANHTVEVKVRDYAFDLSGRSNIQLKKLNIFSAGINMLGAYDCLVEDCHARYVNHFTDAYAFTVSVDADKNVMGGSGNQWKDSSIVYSAGSGIYDVGTSNKVTNCIIHEINYMCGATGAIEAKKANGPEYTWNTMYNSGKYIVRHRESPGIKLMYNHMYDGGLLGEGDGGITYTWGSEGGGSEIAYNIVHGYGYGPKADWGSGIYLDNYCSGFLVHHNLIYDIYDAGMRLNNPATDHKIYNNTILLSSGTKEVAIAAATDLDKDMTGTEIVNNIFQGEVKVFQDSSPEEPNMHHNFASETDANGWPAQDSNAIDAGVVISGITDGYQGSAPDVGCYETGTSGWTAGADWTDEPSAPDTTAPTPDPMTWASDPNAVSSSAITMTATTATDTSGVQYYFDCTAGGGNDSSWQSSTTYVDTGLTAETQYTYRVKARDLSSNNNETGWSTSKSATTLEQSSDTTAPTPDPMTWSTDPYAVSSSSITMVATTASDASGVQYYFDCTAGGGNDSGWQSSTTYTDTGLTASTQYTYKVKARDLSSNYNETALSTAKSATTQAGGGATTLFSDDFETGSLDGGYLGNGNPTVNTVSAYNGTYGVELKKDAWVKRAVSTAGYTSIHVKYARKTVAYDSGEYLYVEWYDGTSWHELEATAETSWATKDWTCASGANDNANFVIRFLCNASGNDEYAYIDDIKVTGEAQ